MNRIRQQQATSRSNGSRQRSRELKEEIYRQLREKVVFLELRPGEFINETRLATELPVSRTILREVLQRLIGDGLLTLAPGQGMYVQSIDLVMIHNLIEVRFPLERFAGRLAAQRAHHEQLQQMNNLIIAGEAALTQGDLREMARHEWGLHRILGEATRNDVLASTLSRLVVPFIRLWYMQMSDRGKFIGDWEDWRNILTALTTRSASASEKAVADHSIKTLAMISPDLSLDQL